MRRDIFQAIADPVRRDIISLLAEEALPVNEVADHFNVSRPAISRHLKILNECGVLSFTRKGRERYCAIKPSQLIPAFMWVAQFRNLWEQRIDTFEQYLMELQLKQHKK